MRLSDYQHIHFVGLGGIGVSALANICHEKGIIVSGSDQTPSDITAQLSEKGVQFFSEHKAENLPENCQLVVFSPAIPPENTERQAAAVRNIPTLSYPQALGLLSSEYFTIAISGTHGKSTTTAMIALSLTVAGLDPTVVIGTKVFEFDNQNYRLGQSKYLVIEACEYRDSFLNFHPDILVITNIEPDHLDYFKTAENYFAAFDRIAAQVKPDGHVLRESNLQITPLKLQVPGEFNQTNANFALKVGELLGLDRPQQIATLQAFRGTWRRMEFHGRKGQTDFFDDYGHHPTEIRVTLGALREKYGPNAKILCIFQPHQYNRTIELLDDFATSFDAVDQVIIPNIYRVRDSETDVSKMSAAILAAKIGPKAIDGGGLDATKKWLAENYQNFDLVITMGAGDVDKILENRE